MRYPVFATIILSLSIACNGPAEKTDATAKDVPQHTKSKNPDAYNQTFESLLTSYYALKDALVEYDTVLANAASLKLAQFADSLERQQPGTSAPQQQVTEAAKFTGTISGSSLALVGESDIQNKRKEFQLISDAMFDLARTVKYDRQKIYRQHCPMAFNDENEAFWLSNSATIVNPYLGRKHPKYRAGMVGCGDVTDSLDFSN